MSMPNDFTHQGGRGEELQFDGLIRIRFIGFGN